MKMSFIDFWVEAFCCPRAADVASVKRFSGSKMIYFEDESTLDKEHNNLVLLCLDVRSLGAV